MNVPQDVAARWIRAMTEHNLDGATACFHPNYRDEAPARRGEIVNGRDQVRRNFERLFRDVPNLRAELLATAGSGDTVWMEWRMSGSRRDGSQLEFAGVNIFELEGDQFVRGRIYTELVRDAGGVDAQLDRMTRGQSFD